MRVWRIFFAVLALFISVSGRGEVEFTSAIDREWESVQVFYKRPADLPIPETTVLREHRVPVF